MKKKRKKKKIKVVERKLGKEKVWGFAYFDDNLIEIDERLRGKRQLRTYIHELCHLSFGEKMPEYKILEAEKIIGNTLWELGYRKIDNI